MQFDQTRFRHDDLKISLVLANLLKYKYLWIPLIFQRSQH